MKDFEKDRVESALTTIFNINVMRFAGGKLGAVNGMTRSGQMELTSMQSEEVWTGITYGLTSTMIMEVIFTKNNLNHNLFYFNRISKLKDFLHLKEYTIRVII